MNGDLALVILAALTVWAVRAYFWPFTQCRKCKGGKVNPGSTGKRWGQCRKCKGSGSRQVRGSKTVHKIVRGVIAARGKKG